MAAPVHYFGIRHHGPGCARCLDEALSALQPAMLLIEGPEDATDLLPLLGEDDMEPPVALLAYATQAAENAVFWPFARFSPEYVAVRYALKQRIPVRLIDLPAAAVLHERMPPPRQEAPPEPAEKAPIAAEAPAEDVVIPAPPAEAEPNELSRDPIGSLARTAGYEDGESWWSDLVEENPAPGPVFEAIASAMTALREAASGELPAREARREAHMRLAIDRARKEVEGPVAVVCGAWHVPALQAPHKAKEDRELLKGLPKVKASLTWAPWTQPRLASGSGYGAGVSYPGWYEHLWDHGGKADGATRWLLRITQLLRQKGHMVSTASLIEAERLAVALAALRSRPSPNFEELRDATVSCLCGGESLLYQTIVADLLIGSGVGRISATTPLAPLLDDLQTQQKKAKLKPEALERELAVDLRSESGLFRSTLLHRLAALEIPWGKLLDAGRSRGTFRENWMLRWEPAFAVKLVEQLVNGPTIEQAATQCLIHQMEKVPVLPALAECLEMAMKARLPDAIRQGIALLSRRAAQTSDCNELLRALSPMAEVLRYGDARGAAQDYLGELMRQIALQAFVGLPYAARDLDEDAAAGLGQAMQKAQRELQLAEFPPDDMESWFVALRQVIEQSSSTPGVAGLAARLLYEADRLAPEEAALLLQRRLSPGVITLAAAGYFEGFLSGIAERLIHDRPLLEAVDQWLMGLEEADWQQNLPLFRRVFANLDSNVRQRLVQAAVRPAQRGDSWYEPAADPELWEAHHPVILSILEKGALR